MRLCPPTIVPFLALCAALAGCATPQGRAPQQAATPPVTVGIVAINDFHGNLEPPRQSVFVPAADPQGGSVGVPAGGAAYLASAMDTIRAQYANAITVSAGDLISGSPLASALFLDEPTVTAMNRMGLEFNAVGNHEFDRGRTELLRMQNGGCTQNTARTPCKIEPFAGAKFQFLAANVVTESGATLFPATAMRSFGSGPRKVQVGLIGLTLAETDTLVSPQGIAGLTFGDEADAINRAVAALKHDGADAIVVLIHQGGRTAGPPNPSGCSALSGAILPILARLDPRVDVVVSGHTHWAYICDYGTIDPARPFLLTSAGVYGELISDIRLEIDPASGKVVDKAARNVIVQSEPYVAGRGPVGLTDIVPRFAPRADVAEYVAKYVAAARDHAQRPAGRIAGRADRPGGELANTGGSLGNLIADAQRSATRSAGAQIAFVNPFGVRVPAVLEPGRDGAVTFGQLYAVQPFNNELITQTLTGAQIRKVLEQGFDDIGPNQVLAPSQGFTYGYDLSRPIGQRITWMKLDGAPIDPAATYRVTAPSFLANGGDTFTELAQGTARTVGGSDIEALEAWLSAPAPRAVPQDQRAFAGAPTP